MNAVDLLFFVSASRVRSLQSVHLFVACRHTISRILCAKSLESCELLTRILVARIRISRKLGFHSVGVGIGEPAIAASMGSLRASIALPVVSAPRVARKESRSVVVPQAGENGGFSTAKRGPLIAEIPLEYIRRPLLRTRNNDPEKVKELMESIAEIGLQEPIGTIKGMKFGCRWMKLDDNPELNARFSGCHRYEAHQKLGLPTIKCKIRRGTRETLRHHLR